MGDIETERSFWKDKSNTPNNPQCSTFGMVPDKLEETLCCMWYDETSKRWQKSNINRKNFVEGNPWKVN